MESYEKIKEQLMEPLRAAKQADLKYFVYVTDDGAEEAFVAGQVTYNDACSIVGAMLVRFGPGMLLRVAVSGPPRMTDLSDESEPFPTVDIIEDSKQGGL